jgi:predicted RNA polymerase sigma factor
MIAEGVALLDASLAPGSAGPYQLQAAIAALHARARSFEQTDWRGIGAAIVIPLSLTILTTAFLAERRGAIVGIWGGIAGLPSRLGRSSAER